MKHRIAYAIQKPREYVDRGKSESMHDWQARAIMKAIGETPHVIHADEIGVVVDALKSYANLMACKSFAEQNNLSDPTEYTDRENIALRIIERLS